MKKIPVKWQKSEENFLRLHYETKGVSYCKKILKRSEHSVKHKAASLGLNIKSKRYTKEVFTDVVKSSISYSDVARKIGLNTGHGNRKTIIKYIDLYKIDISHFTYQGNEPKVKQKINLNKILIKNSTYNTTHLKARLYKEGIKERKCELCGQEEMWHGKKMALILDHKNGVNNDNRLSNLRIVCPNCNSTLDTNCGRNRKNK
jgi:hypothetical protein